MLSNVLVEAYAAEGKSLARVDGKVIFIENAVPGDVVDIRLWQFMAIFTRVCVRSFCPLWPSSVY